MAQGASSPSGTLSTFLTSSLSDAEKAEATSAMHYILGHAHYIATKNGYTFQGDVHRIQGSQILVRFKVDFPPSEEFPETEHYSKTVHLNLRGDYHSQLIYHVIDAIIYVTPVVPNQRYIKHTCCIFTSSIWVHKYYLCHPDLPTYHDHHCEDVPQQKHHILCSYQCHLHNQLTIHLGIHIFIFDQVFDLLGILYIFYCHEILFFYYCFIFYCIVFFFDIHHMVGCVFLTYVKTFMRY